MTNKKHDPFGAVLHFDTVKKQNHNEDVGEKGKGTLVAFIMDK